MLRRPPTSIELKLDDVVEYENARKEQEAIKAAQLKNSKPYNDLPVWQAGPKTKEEIHSRIGYNGGPSRYKESSPEF